MLFYILCGCALVAGAFLLMIAVQLIRIEKSMTELTLLAEHRVKKMYE